VLCDLEVALTSMDVANVSTIRETILRNHQNARTAHDSILRLLGKLTPDELQQQTIDEKLAILKRGCCMPDSHSEPRAKDLA
jgi:hypothetical protein